MESEEPEFTIIDKKSKAKPVSQPKEEPKSKVEQTVAQKKEETKQ